MFSFLEEQVGVSPAISGRIVATIAILVIIVVARYFVARTIGKRVEDPELSFRGKKAATYVAAATAVLLLAFVWFPFINDLATFLGLLSAGIAIALADVFLNLAGWIYVVLRHPFNVGDRIEIGDDAGDVIDIRAFRFTILEIRDWVDADQTTGRVVHIPNARIFRLPMANFTEGFEHVWHEVPLLVTFESDRRRAEQMLVEAMRPVAIPQDVAEAAQKRAARTRDYEITFAHSDPVVFTTVRDSGVLLTGRMMVDARRRRSAEDAVWRFVLDAIDAEPEVSLAYPTQRTYLPDTVRVKGEDGPVNP